MATAQGDSNNGNQGQASEDLSEDLCGPCQLNNENVKAAGLCTTCQEFMCQQCFDAHKVPLPMQNHELLTNSQMIQGHIHLIRKDVCRDYCGYHDDEVINYHCLDHDTLGCHVCVTLEHNTCDHVEHIPKVAMDLPNNKTFLEIDAELQRTQHKSNKISELASQMTRTLKQTSSTAVENFRQYKKDIMEALDKIETELEQKTTRMKTKEIDNISKQLQKCKYSQDRLQTMTDKVGVLGLEKENCSLYSYMVQIGSSLQPIADQLDQVHQELTERKVFIKYVPNDQILDTLKSSAGLGQVSLADGTIERAEHVRDITVKLKQDKSECWIIASVILPSNKLIIADRNNSNLKSVDVEDGQVDIYLPLPCPPLDIVMIEDKQLAVTLPGKRQIAIVTVSATPSVERYIDVRSVCHGVAYSDGKLVVSYTRIGPDKVDILSLQGTVLHTFSNTDVLSCPQYMTFGQDSQTLYVTNRNGSNVVRVELHHGTVTLQASYTDPQLDWPYKLITDSSGTVYVCSVVGHTIHQLSPNLQKRKILLTKYDGLDWPYTISYNELKREIYICGDTDTVKVYKAIVSPI